MYIVSFSESTAWQVSPLISACSTCLWIQCTLLARGHHSG
jgi:hypothetical protein